MADIRTSISIPTRPWEAARARFIEGLSDEQKQQFENATAENVFYSASVAFSGHERGSKTRALQKRLAPFTTALEEYGKAMDVLTNAASMYLCPLWGSLRVVLQLAQSYGKYYDKLLDMFARIGEVLPRYAMFERLFAEHERVLAALSNAYLDILKFCNEAKKMFLTLPKKSAIPFSSNIKQYWKPFDQRFDELIDVFRIHSKTVHKEAEVAHMIEDRKTQALVLASRDLQEQSKKADRRRQLLRTLSSLDYRSQHRKQQKLRLEGTGSWFTEHKDFRSWVESDDSGSFACYGIPGSGKTILASFVIDKMTPFYQDLESAVCYHYCDYSERASLEAPAIFGSLAQQLLNRIEIPPDILSTLADICDNARSIPLADDLQEILLKSLAHFKNVLFVIDGVDELDHLTQDRVIEFEKSLHDSSCEAAKVMVFCRSEKLKIRKAFENPSLSITPEHVGQDVRRFVQESVESKIKAGNLDIGDASLKQVIIDDLSSGTADMFLLARFQIEEICEAVSDEGIQEALCNLPRDIKSMYARIAEKRYTSTGGERKVETARRVFEWLSTARRPLKLNELCEAVAIDKHDERLNRSAIPSNGQRLLDTCGSLVVHDPTDGTVNFAHHSVPQFLFTALQYVDSLDPAAPAATSVRRVALDRDEVETEIGKRCVSYLCFADFETTLAKREENPVLVDSKALTATALARLPSGSPLHKIGQSVASKFSKSASVQINLNTVNATNTKMPRQDFDFPLWNYMSAHWASHAGYLKLSELSDDASWRKLRRVTLERNFSQNIYPWCSSRLSKKLFLENMCLWSFGQENANFLALFAEAYALSDNQYGRGWAYIDKDLLFGNSASCWDVVNTIFHFRGPQAFDAEADLLVRGASLSPTPKVRSCIIGQLFKAYRVDDRSVIWLSLRKAIGDDPRFPYWETWWDRGDNIPKMADAASLWIPPLIEALLLQDSTTHELVLGDLYHVTALGSILLGYDEAAAALIDSDRYAFRADYLRFLVLLAAELGHFKLSAIIWIELMLADLVKGSGLITTSLRTYVREVREARTQLLKESDFGNALFKCFALENSREGYRQNFFNNAKLLIEAAFPAGESFAHAIPAHSPIGGRDFEHQEPALCVAAQLGLERVIKSMSEGLRLESASGPDALAIDQWDNLKSADGLTALELAARNGHSETLRELLEGRKSRPWLWDDVLDHAEILAAHSGHPSECSEEIRRYRPERRTLDVVNFTEVQSMYGSTGLSSMSDNGVD
ncbi:hypothetical protein NA57DRAFT_77359 [Rhizodiscina lignyota]|uniref:NACHT domain-containing protein n=1 Tax=Rhizodiscina lignyota TaxID=1504668 RepID=A0A9P4M8S5_9PEZI|nr:hypothetical protein NA57DRAFT_77359 [Rhizodiscina lignyota]